MEKYIDLRMEPYETLSFNSSGIERLEPSVTVCVLSCK